MSNGYSELRSYEVQSSMITRVEFGSINLTSFPELPAILIRFTSGSEYLYVGVPNDLYNTFERICQANVEGSTYGSIGYWFNRNLRSLPTYARLHQA